MKKIYFILFAAALFMVSCDKASESEEIQTGNQELNIPEEITALMENGIYIVDAQLETETRADGIITTNMYLNNNGREYDVAYFFEDDAFKIPMVLEYPIECNYTVWSIGILNDDPVSVNAVYTKTITIPAGVVSYVLYSGPYTAPAAGAVDYRRYAVTNWMKYVK